MVLIEKNDLHPASRRLQHWRARGLACIARGSICASFPNSHTRRTRSPPRGHQGSYNQPPVTIGEAIFRVRRKRSIWVFSTSLRAFPERTTRRTERVALRCSEPTQTVSSRVAFGFARPDSSEVFSELPSRSQQIDRSQSLELQSRK